LLAVDKQKCSFWETGDYTGCPQLGGNQSTLLVVDKHNMVVVGEQHSGYPLLGGNKSGYPQAAYNLTLRHLHMFSLAIFLVASWEQQIYCCLWETVDYMGCPKLGDNQSRLLVVDKQKCSFWEIGDYQGCPQLGGNQSTLVVVDKKHGSCCGRTTFWLSLFLWGTTNILFSLGSR
jgi:hypothetical protein